MSKNVLARLRPGPRVAVRLYWTCLLFVLSVSLSSCLDVLSGADSHPRQVESGLSPERYGDVTIEESSPDDAGRGDRTKGQR